MRSLIERCLRVPSAMAVIALTVVGLSVGLGASARGDQTVDDETGLLGNQNIDAIESRNKTLHDATGVLVAVVIVHGNNGETALAASDKADAMTKNADAAVIFVATDTEQTDIIFVNQGAKWISADEQTALRADLSGNMRYCCPGETVPGIVDKIAADLEAGAKLPVSGRNYIHDRLGLLSEDQISEIAAREEKLEAATGRGIAVETLTAQPNQLPSVAAYTDAVALNVKGSIAAVIWLAKNADQLSFNVMQSPFEKGLIADAELERINGMLKSDLQAGDSGAAVVAAVDRTASQIEAVSTPPPSESPAATVESASPSELGSPSAEESPQAETTATPAPASNSNAAAWAFFVAIAVLLIVLIAISRRTRHR